MHRNCRLPGTYQIMKTLPFEDGDVAGVRAACGEVIIMIHDGHRDFEWNIYGNNIEREDLACLFRRRGQRDDGGSVDRGGGRNFLEARWNRICQGEEWHVLAFRIQILLHSSFVAEATIIFISVVANNVILEVNKIIVAVAVAVADAVYVAVAVAAAVAAVATAYFEDAATRLHVVKVGFGRRGRCRLHSIALDSSAPHKRA